MCIENVENIEEFDDYVVVVDENQVPLVEKNRIILQKLSTGEVQSFAITNEILEKYDLCLSTSNDDGPDLESQLNLPQPHCSQTNYSEQASEPSHVRSSGGGSFQWSRAATLALIANYGSHESQFKSTTTRNEKVWMNIAEKMTKNGFTVTGTQCRDKFKYLKIRYTKKKDNMSNRSSGAEAIKFEFFEEMDSLFRQDHNIVPAAIASSLGNNTTSVQEMDCDDVLLENKKKTSISGNSRKRKNPIEELISSIKNNAAQKEDNRERRHKEQLEAKKQATDMLASKFDAFLKKM